MVQSSRRPEDPQRMVEPSTEGSGVLLRVRETSEVERNEKAPEVNSLSGSGARGTISHSVEGAARDYHKETRRKDRFFQTYPPQEYFWRPPRHRKSMVPSVE